MIAESYERIHRSNLIGMGVLPLQFAPGESAKGLGLTGARTFFIEGLGGTTWSRRSLITVRAEAESHTVKFKAVVRIDSPLEVDQYRNGGILPLIMRRLLAS